jgi:type I restriction enzyme S subunit
MSEREKLAALRLGLRDDLLTGRKRVVAIREAAE